MYPVDDTIAAIATAPQGAERGVVRVSGPDAVRCVASIFSAAASDWPSRRLAQVIAGTIRLDTQHSMPGELYLWPTGRSYTRQPVAELHTIGSRPLLDRVVVQLCKAGARLAHPGEFTLRAFLAGRLDLPQAEAVLGVIDSESEQQFRVAVRQLAGGLSSQLHQLRNQLLDLCADLEAGLDFVEEDIEFVTHGEIADRLREVRRLVDEMISQMDTRSITMGVPSVAFIGAPNAGKSSLINALSEDDVAIVSPQPGTTRDYVSAMVDILGIRCELIDTAGLEPVVGGGPAAIAQEVASQSAGRAHYRLICIDGSRRLLPVELDWLEGRRSPRDILVATKCDLDSFQAIPEADVASSATTRQGIDGLRRELARRIEQDLACVGETVASTAIRCQDSLRLCRHSLQRAEELAKSLRGDELLATEIRLAMDELGQVLGAVYTDDVLDRIFSRFCIGK